MSGPHDRSAFSEALERLEDDRDASFANGLEIEARQPRMCLENYGKLGPRTWQLCNFWMDGNDEASKSVSIIRQSRVSGDGKQHLMIIIFSKKMRCIGL